MDLTSLGFKKPLESEGYDIGIPNDNMDLADTLIAALQLLAGGNSDWITEKKISMLFDLTQSITPETGELVWDGNAKTLSLGMQGNDVVLQVGEEILIYAGNNDAANILNGQAVAMVASLDSDPAIKLANASVIETQYAVGIATEDINTGAKGYVVTNGLARGINTSAYASGTQLWLDITNGALTDIQPLPQYSQVFVGWVVDSDANGSIFVKPTLVQRGEFVPIKDTGGFYTGTNVEEALQEIGNSFASIVAGTTKVGNADKLDSYDINDLVIRLSGDATNLNLRKYIIFRDYDDDTSTSGYRSYIRDGVWKLNKNTGEVDDLEIQIEGSKVLTEADALNTGSSSDLPYTIVQRNADGNIETESKILFTNNDEIVYNDSSNKFNCVVDGVYHLMHMGNIGELTVTNSGWTASAGDYGYYKNLTLAGLQNVDWIELVPQANYEKLAADCDFSPHARENTDSVTIWCNNIPTSTIMLDYKITKG